MPACSRPSQTYYEAAASAALRHVFCLSGLKMFRNIIWDFDGTLFDTYPYMSAAFRQALNELGADESVERITGLLKVSMRVCVATLSAEKGLDPDALSSAFERHYAGMDQAQQSPYPGVPRICRKIQERGGLNFIVTHRSRASTERLLAMYDLVPLFARCISNDDGYPWKPDPAAFNALIDEYALNREQTLAVGDRDLDVQAAQAAGLFVCRFGTDWQGVAADLTIASYDELEAFLDAPA
jgi:phosphoglycolate phosphatase-like HAD superfamily hydrolase